MFLAYVSEDGTRVTIVHVFADADSMDLHVEGAEERTRTAYEFVEPRGFEIYGMPSEPFWRCFERKRHRRLK